MNKNTPMILLTLIMISVAIYGKWVDGKIHETSEILIKNNLEPQPWLSKSFDYYGTPIQSNFTGVFNAEKVKDNLKDIKEWRVTRDSVWEAYLKCEMSPEEQKIVDKVNDEIKEADEVIDELIENVEDNKNLAETDSLVKSGEIDDLINPIMDDTNALIDLQSSEGATLVHEIQDLLKTFSNFMIAVLALAFILLANVIMKFIKDKKEAVKKPVRRTPVKRKPPVRRTTTKK
jgi:uncharacterized membrane protein